MSTNNNYIQCNNLIRINVLMVPLCHCAVPSPSSSPALRSHCRKFLATTRATPRPSRSSLPVSSQ